MIEIDQQVLKFRGIQMKDHRLISDYLITKNSTIWLDYKVVPNEKRKKLKVKVNEKIKEKRK